VPKKISARLGGLAQTFALEELNDGLFYHAAKTKLRGFPTGVAFTKIGNPRGDVKHRAQMFRFSGVGSGGWGNERERRERARAPGTVREWDSWDRCCTGGRPIYKAAPRAHAITNHQSLLTLRRA
jgi:hypothetical protein